MPSKFKCNPFTRDILRRARQRKAEGRQKGRIQDRIEITFRGADDLCSPSICAEEKAPCR
jgi:hypothetical protein